MSETAALEQFTAELKAIRHDVEYIKEHMVDVDMILTKEEEKRLEESLKEYRQGKSVKLEVFEKFKVIFDEAQKSVELILHSE